MKRSRYLALFFCLAVMGMMLPSTALAGWLAQRTSPVAAQAFNAISGTAPTNMFAVGDLGQLYKTINGGGTWTVTATAAPVTANLYGVWTNATNNAIAVGENGVILRYTGVWAALASPTTNFLNAVWGVPAGNPIIAVGDTDPITGYATILQSIDNGATWTAMTTPPTAGAANSIQFSLYGVWGTSPTDIYAVGESGVIAHYNGLTWSYMAGATPGMNPFNLYAVWGSSPTDVFAVGDGGTILHYDGNVNGQWDYMSTPTFNTLNGIWGSSAVDVFAVGDNGTILHYDGINWTVMPNAGTTLNAVWTASAATSYAVGNGGTVLGYAAKFGLAANYPTGLQFYNGTTTKTISGAVTTLGSYGYNLVASVAPPAAGAGTFLYNGASWTKITTNGGAQNIVEYNGNLLIDYGTAGIWKYNGIFGTWNRVTSTDPAQMAAAGNLLYVNFTAYTAASNGLYKYDGVKWTRITPTSTVVNMVAIGNNLYVNFGAAGVWVYDGYWHKINAGTANAMATFGNLVAISLPTGVYTYDFRLANPVWTLINATPATSMLGVSSSLYANFAATGLNKYTPGATPWTALNATAATLMANRGDNFDALIPAVGIVEYPNNATTGTTINANATATAMVGFMLR